MKITVEFTGAARSVAGTRLVEIEVAAGTTYSQVVRTLAERYPDLTGFIFNAAGDDLLSSVLLYVNETDWIMPGMMDQSPKDGDRLVLLGVITGG